jgi:nucleotide-binding universal stress UspA family protein
MPFNRVLIAVDDSPIAAHAANVGFELARTVQGDAALITGVDPSQFSTPESGISAADFIASAEKDGKRLVAHIGARSGTQPPPLSFVPVGKPRAEAVMRHAPCPVLIVRSTS